MNACTLGKKRKGVAALQKLVEEAIQLPTNRPSDLAISHPASWLNPSDHELKKIS